MVGALMVIAMAAISANASPAVLGVIIGPSLPSAFARVGISLAIVGMSQNPLVTYI